MDQKITVKCPACKRYHRVTIEIVECDDCRSKDLWKKIRSINKFEKESRKARLIVK
ncbi:MAG: hypothetical protein GY853_15705 [PVC group bacterium]|nr:hypothetical protein [PVC group bacterium]